MPDTFDTLFPPRPGRAHEAFGASSSVFAASVAGARGGDVLWLVPAWRTERISPSGLAPFCDPGRVLIGEARDHTDLLALTEEALRSGAVKTVVTELEAALDLTAGRRLQLAAETGRALGLLLIAEGAGSNAAETRWHCTPEFDAADSTRMRWDLIKNKSGTLRTWTVRWDDKAHRIAVVSPPRQ